MKFHKYHGLGNDYLVLNPADFGGKLTGEQIRRICDRNYGLGSDGILFGPVESEVGDFGLLIFNPDGSEAEKSGNGLRIFARYLWDVGKVKGEKFHIVTAGGKVTVQVHADGRTVTVAMGQVSFLGSKMATNGLEPKVLDEEMTINGDTLSFVGADIGNPHCVVLREKVTEKEARRLGPLVEYDKRFVNRTNVQFMQILDRSNIKIEIWERGAGYTLASGSSSCAAAAVAHRLGLCDSAIKVHMPGGQLDITIMDNYEIMMTGPVTKVAEGVLFEEMFS